MQRVLLAPLRLAVGAAREARDAYRRSRAQTRLDQTLAPFPPSSRGHIVFFTPEAGVDPHLVAQCILGKTLQDRGHDVLFVRCFGLQRRCPVMDLHGAPFDLSAAQRQRLCLNCADHSFRRLEAYGLPVLDLRAFVTTDLRSTVADQIQSAPEDLREFTFDGVAFGELCIVDLVLARKVSDLANLRPDDRSVWLAYIETCLASYLLVQRVCEAIQVNRVVHYNDYAGLLGGRLAAQRRQIPCVSVVHAPHRSVDRRRILFMHEAASIAYHSTRNAWAAHRDLALPPELIQEIGEDTLERFRGRAAHVYSPPKTFGRCDLRARLRLDPVKRLLVAYTSSLDEMLATEVARAAHGYFPVKSPQPFKDQIEWLGLLSEQVERRADVQLVVRVHPREGANKRDNLVSQHLEQLRARFDHPFRNCRVVWPGDPISSYDLGELADVVLVSWSTIGLEFARMGVPVLTSTSGLAAFPHDDFLEWASTPEEYFRKLDDLLDRPASIDTVARAYRWYNLYHLGRSIDLSDVVPTPSYEGMPPFRTPLESHAIEAILVEGKEAMNLNRERLLANQDQSAQVREEDALRRLLRRLVRCILTGDTSTADYDTTPPVGEDQERLSAEGRSVRYTAGTRTWLRDSPMCARLVPLCVSKPTFRPGLPSV